jgi:hypothetical protein
MEYVLLFLAAKLPEELQHMQKFVLKKVLISLGRTKKHWRITRDDEERNCIPLLQ